MRILCLLAFAISVLAAPALAETPVPERRLALVRDVDYPGSDLQSIFDTTLKACEAACLADDQCRAFTYNTRTDSCFTKSAISGSEVYEGAFSGRVIDAAPAAVALSERRATELRDFMSEHDLAEARDMTLDLTNRHIPGNWSAADLLQAAVEARAQGNPLSAYRFTGAATVLTDAADQWTEYARLALGIQASSTADQRSYRLRALRAATNAYLRAESAPAQATALSVLAQAMEENGRGRDMIPALRLAQALSPRDETDKMLEAAIGKYGFRIVEHSVDSDPAEPRVCAEFNESLVLAGVDYAPYVQIPNAELTVEAAQRQLCIAGVAHGDRYEITFREGLPSASGETLAKNVTLNLYVPDRSPSVRFPGRAYVLPAGGDIALPIVTVNLNEVELVLRRVSDRSILRAIQDGYFGRPMSAWEESMFGDNVAETVWQGTGEVGLTLNRDVTTRLPMGEVVGDLTPGIYALRAAIEGADPYDTPAATQWFVVSDLGLATMDGADGLHAFVRSLTSADPASGVELTLLSRANSVLGTATTDGQGYAQFAPGLLNGTGGASPAMLIAHSGDSDLGFLSLTEPEFDLSDRGVEGRAPAGPVDVFLTTDRGAYRAGETINATALARDATADAVGDLPLIAVLSRPDGVEYSRHISRTPMAGGHVFSFTTSGSVPRGGWRLEVFSDPDAPALASSRVLVEDFLPERIDFDLTLPDGLIHAGEQVPLSVDARYLFGPPAGDLPIEGEYVLRGTDTLENWPGYRFGNYDAENPLQVEFLPGSIRTAEDGSATLDIQLPDIDAVGKPLEAVIAVRLSEGSGRPVERKLTRDVAPNGPVIGIKPNFDGTLAEDSEASFSLIALDETQDLAPMQVQWTINRIQRRYQWYQLYGNWNWEPITRRTKVATGTATLGESPVTVTAPVGWGTYEIRVERTGADYVSSARKFYAGWYGGADASSTPDLLEVSLDAEAYAAGDTAKLRLVPRYAGKALVTVVSNHLIDMKAVEVTEGENIVELAVSDEWGAGAYVTASVIRPMDAEAGRNPTRALGLSYAQVDPGRHRLGAAFETAAEADPRGPLPVALKVDGVAPGETAYVTIAAVDVGILNITGFETPDPEGYYFGQRKLGMAMRDVYGRLIDGLNGAMGAVRSGGDASPEAGTQAPPPTEELVAYFSGPLEVGADGYARTSFDLPSFNGTVRLMAVVWSKTGIGQANTEVLVRDPVVVTASLPRFMAPGDSARLLLEFVHTSGAAGRMGLDITGDGVTLDRGSVPSGLRLEEQGKASLSIPFTADAVGIHKISVALSTPDGKVLTKTLTLPVEINDPAISRTSRFELAAGDTFTFDENVFAGLRRGTASSTVAAGPIARLDAPGLLNALDRYPYGCTEQVTSRALPLLYLADVAQAMGLSTRDDLELRIKQSIERVLSNQASNGAFGLWRPSSGDFWLDAYVTDFLSRARAQGFKVPDTAFRQALDNLRNRVNYAPDFDSGGQDIAYALYVLAREGAASIGDLRYYSDVKGQDFATPLASAQIGAALAAYGDPTRADRMFARAAGQIAGYARAETRLWRSDYGTRLRDAAAVLTLAVEAGSNAVPRDALVRSIAGVRTEARYRSTQEQVWTLLATHAIIGDAGSGNLTLNGTAVQGPLVRVVDDDTAVAPLAIRNTGDKSTTITLTSFGVPEVPEPKGGNGYAIERRYFTLEGDPADPSRVAAGTRLVAVLTVKPFGNSEARLMVDDPLPAGFEIDNPNLLRGGDIRSLDWLELNADTRTTEFRQNRFLAAVDWRSDKEFRLGYMVRAVTPGDYHHPAASVEDMYRPQFRALTAAGRVQVTQ